MAEADVPMLVVSRFLGHTDSSTTERVYAHHSTGYLVSAREALDRRR